MAKKEIEFENLPASEIDHLINEWITGRDAERNRLVLHRRLIDGICFEPLAEEFDMSVRQIKTIVYKGELRIKSHIK